MKINLTNIKSRKMNQEIFTITLLLESKFESNYIEKSNKYFLNLGKQKAVNGTAEKIIKNDIEITDQMKSSTN